MHDQTTTFGELRERVRAFIAARNWQRFHHPRNLAMSIAIEAAELMEHFQWEDGRTPDWDEVGEELADILLYCFAFAEATGIDMAAAMAAKIDKNEIRFPPQAGVND